MMDYLWLKAIHIAAVITWAGGMLAVAVTTTAFSVVDDETLARRGAFFAQVRRWDQRVTTPAMLLVWAFGLGLAVTGQWLSQPWLLAKIALVLALSGLHGRLSGGLRRLALGQPWRGGGKLRFAAVSIIGIVCLVVTLVVTKPF